MARTPSPPPSKTVCVATLVVLAWANAGCVSSDTVSIDCAGAEGMLCAAGGSQTISDVEMNATGEAIGIWIEPTGDAVFTLQNISVTGSETGIHIVMSGCAGCHVVLRDVSIEAGRFGIYMDRDGQDARLELLNVSILTEGGGKIERAHVTSIGPDGLPRDPPVPDGMSNYWERESEDEATHGLFIGNLTSLHLSIDNVVIDAKAPSGGRAIGHSWSNLGLAPRNCTAASPAPCLKRLDVSGLTVANYRTAIRLNPLNATLYDVKVDCMVHGILLGYTLEQHNLEGARIDSRGCTGVNMALTGFRNTIALEEVHLVGGFYGIHEYANDFRIHNFTIEDTAYGISAGNNHVGKERASYSDGLVANATYAGIRADHAYVDVQRVRFTNNGRGWPDLADPSQDGNYTPLQYGGIVALHSRSDNTTHLIKQITQCSFEGNEPFALTTTSATNATMNWWGAVDGPRLVVPTTPLAAGGSGDNVTAYTALVVPFLTSPP